MDPRINECAINMLSLEGNGYESLLIYRKNYCAHYQKTVYGENKDKALYDINVYLWDFTPFDSNMPIKASVEVRFYRKNGVSFDIKLMLNEETTIQEMEAFYQDAYNRMGCTHFRNEVSHGM